MGSFDNIGAFGNTGFGMQLGGTILGFGGNVFSSFSNYQQSKQSAALLRAQAGQTWVNGVYQASIQEMNASLLAKQAGRNEASAMSAQKDRLANMEVGYAASGVTMSGSAAHVMAKQAEADAINNAYTDEAVRTQQLQYLMNAESIRMDAMNTARGLEAQARAVKKAGKINLFSGMIGSASNLLGGLGGVAGNAYQYGMM